MGATTPTLTLRERSTGQVKALSCYFAGADAAGYVVPVTGTGVAGAGSPKDFMLPPGVWDIVYLTGPATGVIRPHCNGEPGPIALNTASIISMVARNNTHGSIRGGTNFRYSLVVEIAMAA